MNRTLLKLETERLEDNFDNYCYPIFKKTIKEIMEQKTLSDEEKNLIELFFIFQKRLSMSAKGDYEDWCSDFIDYENYWCTWQFRAESFYPENLDKNLHDFSMFTCFQKKEKKSEALIGKKFGKLVVLSINGVDKKTGQKNFNCLCECGKKTIAGFQNLKTGQKKSCGCLLRESYIANQLKQFCVLKYDAIPEYRILKNPKTGCWLPYDIYIPQFNMYIEVNGSHHYKRNKMHKTKLDFEKQRQRDKLKVKFAKKNGNYLEIDLRKILSLDDAIRTIKDTMMYLVRE